MVGQCAPRVDRGDPQWCAAASSPFSASCPPGNPCLCARDEQSIPNERVSQYSSIPLWFFKCRHFPFRPLEITYLCTQCSCISKAQDEKLCIHKQADASVSSSLPYPAAIGLQRSKKKPRLRSEDMQTPLTKEGLIPGVEPVGSRVGRRLFVWLPVFLLDWLPFFAVASFFLKSEKQACFVSIMNLQNSFTTLYPIHTI